MLGKDICSQNLHMGAKKKSSPSIIVSPVSVLICVHVSQLRKGKTILKASDFIFVRLGEPEFGTGKR